MSLFMYENLLDFVCDYCNRTFTRKYNLQTHIENCHLNTSTICGVCLESFGSPSGLHLHLERGHNRNNEGFPECDICGKIFRRKQNIISHMLTVHLQGISKIRCRICLKSFTTQRNLRRHLKQIHSPDFELFQCDHCSKAFKGKHSLIAHIQTIHLPASDSVSCDQCHKVFTNARNLRRHQVTCHSRRGDHACRYCPKRCASARSLAKHVRVRHNPNSAYRRGYSCQFCGEAHDHESSLRTHVRSAHTFDEFYSYCRGSLLSTETECSESYAHSCELCAASFAGEREYRAHLRSAHAQAYAPATCNVCFAKLLTVDGMAAHRRQCRPPRGALSCRLCDKLFTEPSSLEFHTRVFHPQSVIFDRSVSSTNPDPAVAVFRCAQCERVYYSDRSLKHHMRLKHSADAAEACPECGKVCSNKYYLAIHMKMHTDQDLWRCEHCDKVFRSKRNIRRHIETTHLDTQRYRCVECHTLFKEKRSLRKHVRTKHPNSKVFPQCHICKKRFESAKSCKIHLKLIHSFNMNCHPCHLCSVSFASYEPLKAHLQTSHMDQHRMFKCDECNIALQGQESLDHHNLTYHPAGKQKTLPKCLICVKDFSSRKTLRRHIKRFHIEFEPDELADFGARSKPYPVDCEACIKKFLDDDLNPQCTSNIVFTCERCNKSYTAFEYSIQRYRFETKGNLILSELCTAEMSGDEIGDEAGESVEPESTTVGYMDQETMDRLLVNVIKVEPE